ncbi:hypothetical protein JTE90_014630 [Oedothorax gibbosus]|uniref:Uncharacterized protein n=1 Tax=Oedothorax gibbosus TaxID=931172 RepID=A0AAV6V840_9ARAC|nr:hypothetical protein JTE90_014630 [Oedothorax gibbosus]
MILNLKAPMTSYFLAGILVLVVLIENHVHSEATSSGTGSDSSDTSSIPILASGKRQHNIMRFGKRPSSGHSLMHFGKRDDDGPAPVPVKGHSFLYFGKRSSDQAQPSSFWDYFQGGSRGDGSYKRGHSIMRFGKRGGGPLDHPPHSFIRFGRQIEDEDDGDLEKRSGHSMMYFGKRGTGNAGHSMMYFGKRGTGTAGHSMMYFGKRGNNGHSMMYFGKRDDGELEDEEDSMDKRAHAMIHFGKRDDLVEEDKRAAHSMIHFGKRGEDPRKSSHAMIHFGKRDFDDEDIDEEEIDGFLDPRETMKRQHNLLRFGKKSEGKGSHAMIHFGKRDDMEEDKRAAHSMIHFGKRSAEEGSTAGNVSDKVNRKKREVAPLIPLARYNEEDEEVPASEESLKQMQGFYGLLDHQEDEWEPSYIEYAGQPDKKETAKNAFLRFG